MSNRKAAHFLLSPELAYSPPNDALVNALLDLGYEVDLYAPGNGFDVSRYGPKVTARHAQYGYRWIARNLLSRHWLEYSLFSGTTEDPMAFVGLLARTYRRPCITLADEIKNGNYSGDRSLQWKALCRSGMRASALTIVNETERVELHRQYAGLSANHPFVVYPGCFRELPAPWNREDTRRARGIPAEALVVCYSGVFNLGNGGLWLANAVEAALPDVWFWGQVIHSDPLVNGLLRQLRGAERMILEPQRMSWREAWASMGAVDIGIVVYLQDAPQFRHMGTASNRLCMFLAMGVPVIASRQPSFEFVEEYDCGVLVTGEHEMVEAIGRIADRRESMQKNALRCAREYIRAPARFSSLRERIRALSRA